MHSKGIERLPCSLLSLELVPDPPPLPQPLANTARMSTFLISLLFLFSLCVASGGLPNAHTVLVEPNKSKEISMS